MAWITWLVDGHFCEGSSVVEGSVGFLKLQCISYAGSMAIDPIQLTRQLVDIDSTTYHEGLAGAFLYELLTSEGYAVEKMPVEQPELNLTPGGGTEERYNVYAALPGVTPDVVLSTHMDTVPPYFGAREDDEFIHGRGTCDAKGIIAAQIAAADRLRAAGVKVGLLFVVGEERDSAGASLEVDVRLGGGLVHRRLQKREER